MTTPLKILLQVLAVLVIFVAVGSLCGLFWYLVWEPQPGVIVGQQWYPDPIEAGLRAEFSGTALYVVIALPAGLLVGALTSYFFDRSELATLVAVMVGSALAGWVMLQVGMELGPVDPSVLAETSPDFTEADSNLTIGSSMSANPLVERTPLLCFPMGALLGLSAVYLLTRSRRTDESQLEPAAP